MLRCNKCGIPIRRKTLKGKEPKYCDECRKRLQEEWKDRRKK